MAAPAVAGVAALIVSRNPSLTPNQVKQVLKNQAQSLELQLLKDGAMKTSELQRRVPGLKRAVGKYKNLTDTNWITKVYKDKFIVEDGTVRLKRPGSAPASSSGGLPNSPLNSPPNIETLLVSREGGSSSSRALPANYSVPALTFRGVVEQPGKRAAQQEAKRLAEALKEEQKKAKRDAQNQKWIEQEKRRVDRYVKQALR
jgi:subtilisin family serine protease